MLGLLVQLLRFVRHLGESCLLHGWAALCRRLSWSSASWMGGKLARSLGPWTPAHRVALRNLALVFPGWSEVERETVARDAWENLGRTMAEFPKLGSLDSEALKTVVVQSEGTEWIAAADGPLIIVSMHYGNWELCPRVAAALGKSLHLVYRSANNPYADRWIVRQRHRYAPHHFAKGRDRPKQLIAALQNGGAIGMLVDQKIREGTEVSFLGQRTNMPSTPAQLALRYGCPIVLARVRRLKEDPDKFQLEITPPLVMASPVAGDAGAVERVTQAVATQLELWIREDPSQWFWVHRRWPKEYYREGVAPGRQK
jgi:KDO2-lipid IV(A) lauroyltransferase